MKSKGTDNVLMAVLIISFLLLSISFLLMPLGVQTLSESISPYMLFSGVLFWFSLAMGVIVICILAHRRRAWLTANKTNGSKSLQNIGLISFFKNKYAVVADVIAIISLIGLVVAIIITQATGYICYIFLCLVVFSFCMHCILNGRIFLYLTNKNVMLRASEKERAHLSKRGGKAVND